MPTKKRPVSESVASSSSDPSEAWVVMYGEQYEGGTLASMHRTEAGAKKAVTALKKSLSRGAWEERPGDGHTIWLDQGCTWVEIRRYSLLD